MALRIHALYEGIVVAALRAVRGRFPGPGAGKGAHQQSHAGAHPGALVSTRRCTCHGAHGRAHGSTEHAAVDGDLVGRRPADLLEGILSANGIIGAELIEILVSAGHHHDARSGRHGGARAQYQERRQG